MLGRYAVKIAQADGITGKFNAHHENRVLVVADEAVRSIGSRADAIIKDMITSPVMQIEERGAIRRKLATSSDLPCFATIPAWSVRPLMSVAILFSSAGKATSGTRSSFSRWIVGTSMAIARAGQRKQLQFNGRWRRGWDSNPRYGSP
ncbi:primase-helicase family protein [Sphingomonas sp.]|uniref:primase-helicase family protein n=1 Tax=Sphingomonas sp. TaxID=28214 RepID=UPI0035C79DF0